MKKYFIASVVAVLAFAFAAFAASLNVNAGPLAAGVDNLACADDVDVSFVTFNDGQGHWIHGFDLLFSDESCDGADLNISFMDEPAGVEHVSPQQVVNMNVGPVDGDTLSYTFPNAAHGHIRVEDVEQVQVLVGEQGGTPFLYVRDLGILETPAT